MPHSAYPTGAELLTYLLSAGFSQAFLASLELDATTLGPYALAGAASFEQAAGRRMLATTQTREFDPRRVGPRGVLDVKADVLSVSAVSYGTQVFTAATDYRLLPLNSADDGTPYFLLEFPYWRLWYRGYPYGLSTLITVTGSWGYGTTIPDDAWLAMLAFAALALSPTLLQARTMGMVEWSESDMHEAFGPTPFSVLLAGWQRVTTWAAGGLDERGKRITGTYTRVTVGVG